MRKAIVHLKKSDPALSRVIERVGPYRIQFREPDFQTLTRSIVYQQLSGKVASVIFGRLVECVPGGALTPRAILKLTPERMRAAGLSGQKTAYIRDLAARTKSGEVNFAEFAVLSDEDVIERLTRVKGIGVWTAQMFLMFALRRTNVLPAGDLGVRSAVRKIYQLEALPHPREVEKLAERWHPYCSVAAWYLWRSLDNAGEI